VIAPGTGVLIAACAAFVRTPTRIDPRRASDAYERLQLEFELLT